ncbi:ectonucleotide pyrophosphatase/phosphodiesterase family member 5-like isoform X2 [Athalia rosae]|uniref:ectonucleotide pyrophosphatase/phosphodiesterase family member 5-like isoform X2 n=1 Tax=Athalia rosae TaxID=37344 RepID=UPI0020338DC4|nr:ectonucleotide pyrophosphatase/phosphodiesterase family member 5-like isoform X2 [Athalia rosae]
MKHADQPAKSQKIVDSRLRCNFAMRIVTSHLLFFLFISTTKYVSSVSPHPKLLVVSFDAFRYDYFKKNMTPYMDQLRDEGTHADYMYNIYPTKTFPNHHTIATGFYAETHGVVANTIKDPISGKIERGSDYLFHYNNDIAPIWIVNEKAGEGRHSGVMMWPGCNFKFLDILPTFQRKFDKNAPWLTSVDDLISWFTHPTTPINFGMLYMSEPDEHGHAYAYDSGPFKETLRRLDNLTRYIQNKLIVNGLSDINVIYLSDHGMAPVTESSIIDLNKFVNQSDYEITDGSPGLHIFPTAGKFDLVYEQLLRAKRELGHFTVFKREEIPDRFHYGKNPRVAPIYVIADIGYVFQDYWNNIRGLEKQWNYTATNETEFGFHGWSPEEESMRPMFFGNGPSFKKHYTIDPFHTVDLFPLFCNLLDLPCPPTNGTFDNVKDALKSSASTTTYKLTGIIIGVLVLLGFVCVLVWFIKRWRAEKSSTYYSTEFSQ